MKKMLFVGLGIVALNGLLACENVDSSDVMTSGVYADINATADGSGHTLVQTSLRVGGAHSNTFLDLVDDDKLTVSQGDDVQQMERQSLFAKVWYEKSFAVDAADTPFTIAFTRTVDQGAPNSSLTLPAPFEISAPAEDAHFSRMSDDIVVSWDPAGSTDSMRLSLDGNCIRILQKDLSGDDGQYTIAHDDIELSSDADEGTSCTLTLTLQRRRVGQLDPGYGEGGQITGMQTRTIEIQSEM